MTLRARLAFALVIPFLGLFAPPARAQDPTFGPALTLSSDNDSTGQQVAVSAGHVYVVWSDRGDVFIRVSEDAGASFLPKIKLTENSGGALYVQVAAAGANVYVAWVYASGGPAPGLSIAASKNHGKTFGDPVSLSNATHPARPHIAAAGENVYVVWDESGDVFFRRGQNNGDDFSTAALNLTNSALGFSFAKVSASGAHVYVTWEGGGGIPNHTEIFFRASDSSGAAFSSILTVSNSPSHSARPQIAAVGNRVFIAWSDWASGNSEIWFRASDANGAAFADPINISNTAGSSIDHQLAVSGSAVYLVWSDDTPGNREITS